MERAVIIVAADGTRCELNIKAAASSLFLYKANFNRDGLADILALAGLSRLDPVACDIVLGLLWAFAKARNGGLQPYTEWVSGYGLTKENLAMQTIGQVTDVLSAFTRAAVKAKRMPSKKKGGGTLTTEMVLHRAVERGLTAADFETMTLGMIIDYLVTCQNEDDDAKKKAKNHESGTRMATDAEALAW